ncbi:MAG: response regulator [Clostridia bacterium]|nr:response regulator [Clostridia bacterium]
MKEFYDLYIFLLMLTSGIGLLLGYIALKRRGIQGAIPLAILMTTISIWSFFQIMTLLVPEFEMKIMYANLRFIGVQITPIAFYALAWEYKHRTKSLKLKQYLKIMIFPAIIFHAIWNNSLHHRFYTDVYMQDGILMMKNGPLLWANMIYLYFFILAGIFLFIKSYQGSKFKHRQQALIIVFAAFIPLVSNLIFNLIPSMKLDLTPISFLITGLLFFYAIFHYKLLDLIPIARDLLVEEMEDIMIVLDNNHRVLDMNKKAREILLDNHTGVADYIGLSIFSLTEHWNELTQAICNKEVTYARISFTTPSQTIYFDLSKSELFDKNGVKVGEIVDLRNITALEEALLEAKKARAAAESANKTKGYFLANMSHEIRTPMNAIIGIAEMLDTEEFSKDEQKRYNQIIIKSAESLLATINDILDLSKVEAGKMELDKGTIDLAQIIKDTLEVFEISTSNRSIILGCSIDQALPKYLQGDAVKIRQILVNLIGNSVKFTKEGKVDILLRYLGSKDGKNAIEITVKDTGLGIPADKLDVIFDNFKQADSSTTRKYGGTGLGLSIVKSLIELMDGSIRVESELGEGSRFIISLELEDAAAALDILEESTVPRDSDLSGLKLLIAEDNSINREIIGLYLKKLGCDYDIVENGRLAVESFEKGQYDMVLMDVQMPEMDGLEAARIIRNKERDTGSKIPIIALTASAMVEDIDKCLAAGMDAHISKPLKVDKLREAIDKILNGKN